MCPEINPAFFDAAAAAASPCVVSCCLWGPAAAVLPENLKEAGVFDFKFHLLFGSPVAVADHPHHAP